MSTPKKKPASKAKPAKKPAPASPPMIPLRLPSEKPTREDGDELGNISIFWDNGSVTEHGWKSGLSSSPHAVAWIPRRLPDGILPREPSHEEKWRAEGKKLWPEVADSMTAANIHDSKEAFLRGFLAAKKGGAE